MMFILLIFLIITINAQNITWTTSGTTSFYWRNGIYGIHNNILHILGGVDNNGAAHTQIFKYNFGTSNWETPVNIPSSPGQYYNFELWTRSFTQIGSIIYYVPRYCGGTTGCDVDVNSEMYSYDMSTSTFNDTWVGSGGAEPGGAAVGAVCAGNGYIYSLGGFNGYGDWTVYSGAHRFNIVGGSWSTIFNLKEGVAQGTCHFYDAGNRLYLIGGTTKNSGSLGPVQKWLEIGDGSDTWSVPFRLKNNLNEDLMAQETGIIDLSGTSLCNACILIYGGVERGDDVTNAEFALNYVWKLTYNSNINGDQDTLELLNDRLSRTIINGAIALNPINYQLFGPIGGASAMDGISVNVFGYGCIKNLSFGSLCSTNNPTTIPSDIPTKYPTNIPTINPTKLTKQPTKIPTNIPTNIPTKLTKQPSKIPTKYPTMYPTKIPTKIPSITPTLLTKQPTIIPTIYPTLYPTQSTNIPTKIPTNIPTDIPTNIPTLYPTKLTNIPTKLTQTPTKAPNNEPTMTPTVIPSITPTKYTSIPTNIPTIIPTNIPTLITLNPTNIPSTYPTILPTKLTNVPTLNPSIFPTIYPTQNTKIPTNIPTHIPTNIPTQIPSNIPSNIPTMITTVMITTNQGNSQLIAGLNNFALLGIIGGIVICIGLLGCIGCYIGGRYRQMQKQSNNETQMRKELQDQLNKAHSLLTSMSSMNSMNNTTNNINTDHNNGILPPQPQVTDDGLAIKHINDIAEAQEGAHERNTTEMVTLGIGEENEDDINKKELISDGDYAVTGGDNDNDNDDHSESSVIDDPDIATTDGGIVQTG